MKKAIFFILILSLLMGCSSSFSEADPSEALKAKHTTLVENTMKSMVLYGCDAAVRHGPSEYFDRSCAAWKRIEKFDAGWFTKVKSAAMSNIFTENWQSISDTQFSVDAFCDYTIEYSYEHKKETFHCAYRFVFTLASASRDLWKATDFCNLALETEAEHAQKFTSACDGITVTPVTGQSYIGYMAVIDDPSRIFVGTIDSFGNKVNGYTIDKLVKKYDAVGGINGGGFSDTAGQGSGGMPSGLIVSNGKQLQRHSPNGQWNVIVGFDQNDRLVIGQYASVDELGLRDAMAFDSTLVVNGEVNISSSSREKYTARTAIGQDAEGKVLMLVVMGRQPNSLGASYEDLANVMLNFGAVTAANLDGGTSTCLYLNNESVYSGYRLNVSRRIPAGFLIRKAS